MRVPIRLLCPCGDNFIAARGRTLITYDQKTYKQLSSHVFGDSDAVLNSAGEKYDEPWLSTERLEGTEKTQDETKANLALQRRMTQMITINHLVVTEDGCHVIVATSDKSVHVFEHTGNGILRVLSKRTMPKRPSSIAVDPDTSSIIIADKFGDVFSIPLVPSSEPKTTTTTTLQPRPKSTTILGPQADESTVHTKKNLAALAEQRRRQQASSASQPTDSPTTATTNTNTTTPHPQSDPPFEMSLLLGHVSMLTALVLAHDSAQRPYIITADRDEHIRVSRGKIGHTHVIESYCLGHTQFVSALCVPRKFPDLLVSGGGDGVLRSWRWKEGKGVDSKPIVWTQDQGAFVGPVTGIVEVGGRDGVSLVAVTCERTPYVFIYGLSEDGSLSLQHEESFSSPVLGVAPLPPLPQSEDGEEASLLVISNGQVTERSDDSIPCFQAHHLTISKTGAITNIPVYFECDPAKDREYDLTAQGVDNILYTTETTLRKQDNKTEEGQDE